ncbi:MAG: DGQHR domain-containing protein [Novosphingobium sp.]
MAKVVRRLRDKLRVPVLISEVMGVKVARGFARLCDLADMSRPDIYDAKTNPAGTQRDLSPKHARDAYEYIRGEELGFFPEVFLALRDADAVSIEQPKTATGLGYLNLSLSDLRNSKAIKISRIDGNHRLHYADGKSEGFPKVTRTVSFCLAFDLNKNQEIKLFRDINNNQRRMNTSHLDNIEVRLQGTKNILERNPPLYIANKLKDDKDSPLFGKVYDGGRTDVTKFIPIRTLKTGIEYMLSQHSRLSSLEDTEIEYVVVKNYFSSLKLWHPEAWNHPKDYLMLRGAGLWGVCFLGAEVIDRALAKGKFKPTDMLAILRSGKEWDWSKNGDFQGLSGRGGALKISGMVSSEFADEGGTSLKSLARKISAEIK